MLDWDLLDDDCSSLVGWTDADTGTGASTQVTYDSRSTFKFNTPNADNSQAARYKVQSVPDTFTAEIVLNLVDLNRFGFVLDFITDSKHRYLVYCYNHSVALLNSLTNPLYTDVFLVPYAGVSPPPTGAESTTLTGNWITYRLVVKASRLADVWVNDRCVLENVTCEYTHATTSNQVQLIIQSAAGTAIGAAEIYVDSIKLDTTPEAPVAKSPVRVGSESYVAVIAQKSSWEYGGSSHTFPDIAKTRIYIPDVVGNMNTHGVTMVSTADSSAGVTRVNDGAATKSLRKIPT